MRGLVNPSDQEMMLSSWLSDAYHYVSTCTIQTAVVIRCNLRLWEALTAWLYNAYKCHLQPGNVPNGLSRANTVMGSTSSRLHACCDSRALSIF